MSNANENWYIILYDLFSRLWYIATCGPFCKDATHIVVVLGVEDTDLEESTAQTNICKMVVEWVETTMLRSSLDEVINRVNHEYSMMCVPLKCSVSNTLGYYC